MPDATSLHHCLKNKQLKLMLSEVMIQQKESKILWTLRGVWVILAYLLYRKEMSYTLQPPFSKAGLQPVCVQCLNSSQDSSILMMVPEAVM